MAVQDPDQDGQDRNVEVAGDTNSADIVGRTGEQMPRQSHDGVESDDRLSRLRLRMKTTRIWTAIRSRATDSHRLNTDWLAVRISE